VRTPIVAVTANAMREDYDRCRDAGMDDFVTKPVTLAALANAIERAVAANLARSDEPGAGPLHGPDETESNRSSADDLVIDRAALAALQEDLGGAAALARIVQLFLEQLEPQTEQILQGAASSEYEQIARIAHRMKSSSATLGADDACRRSRSDRGRCERWRVRRRRPAVRHTQRRRAASAALRLRVCWRTRRR